jgi:hypothetical protein
MIEVFMDYLLIELASSLADYRQGEAIKARKKMPLAPQCFFRPVSHQIGNRTRYR